MKEVKSQAALLKILLFILLVQVYEKISLEVNCSVLIFKW